VIEGLYDPRSDECFGEDLRREAGRAFRVELERSQARPLEPQWLRWHWRRYLTRIRPAVQGGVPLHVVGGKPGGLLLQNLVELR
jgi:hypothetical protein